MQLKYTVDEYGWGGFKTGTEALQAAKDWLNHTASKRGVILHNGGHGDWWITKHVNSALYDGIRIYKSNDGTYNYWFLGKSKRS